MARLKAGLQHPLRRPNRATHLQYGLADNAGTNRSNPKLAERDWSAMKARSGSALDAPCPAVDNAPDWPRIRARPLKSMTCGDSFVTESDVRRKPLPLPSTVVVRSDD
jgi:hypothetical protein